MIIHYCHYLFWCLKCSGIIKYCRYHGYSEIYFITRYSITWKNKIFCIFHLCLQIYICSFHPASCPRNPTQTYCSQKPFVLCFPDVFGPWGVLPGGWEGGWGKKLGISLLSVSFKREFDFWGFLNFGLGGTIFRVGSYFLFIPGE